MWSARPSRCAVCNVDQPRKCMDAHKPIEQVPDQCLRWQDMDQAYLTPAERQRVATERARRDATGTVDVER